MIPRFSIKKLRSRLTNPIVNKELNRLMSQSLIPRLYSAPIIMQNEFLEFDLDDEIGDIQFVGIMISPHVSQRQKIEKEVEDFMACMYNPQLGHYSTDLAPFILGVRGQKYIGITEILAPPIVTGKHVEIS